MCEERLWKMPFLPQVSVCLFVFVVGCLTLFLPSTSHINYRHVSECCCTEEQKESQPRWVACYRLNIDKLSSDFNFCWTNGLLYYID